ncbi:MAG: sugar ABC transporter permease [Firmicutes bacterium]|nr:sugar ABC transporter permease [Bacillota bacterium]
MQSLRSAPFIAPFIILVFLFYLVPVLLTAVLSGTGMDFTMRFNFVGLKNFARILSDSVLPQILHNTLVYVFFTCLLNVGFGFILALLTTYFIKNENIGLFFRTLWLLPRMTPPVIYALLWLWFLDPTEKGMLNVIVGAFGRPPQNWILNNPMPTVILANGLIGVSLGMVIFSSAIKSIPDELYKAAMIDGAGDFKIIRHIILPLVKWPLMFLTVWQILSLITSYEYIMLITDGGPLFNSEVLSLYSYHKAFSNLEFGYGAALAVILVLIGILVTTFMLKVFGFDRMMDPSRLNA